MFKFLRRRSSQISQRTIIERGIDEMVSDRDHHLSMMNQYEKIINDAQTAYNQHTRLYEALNNALFAINHPFDPVGEELAGAIADIDFDADLSVDQPSDEERAARDCLPLAGRPLAPTPQELADAEPLTRSARRRANKAVFRKATAAEAAA